MVVKSFPLKVRKCDYVKLCLNFKTLPFAFSAVEKELKKLKPFDRKKSIDYKKPTAKYGKLR